MKNIIILSFIAIINLNISFGQSPVTDFTYDIRKVNCDYYLADFYYNSSSTADVDSCCWDFGDGDVKCRSNTNAASHNYSEPGLFSVTLKLWKDGIESNIVKNDLVKVTIPPTPNFELIISDSNLYAPLCIMFQNTTELGDCEVLNYTWDFGDGNSSQDKNPEYIFNSPNTYFVSLNVTDTLGCEKEYADYVIVKDTAQNGEFDYIVCNCSENTCDYSKNHIIERNTYIINELVERNDSIVFSGIMVQNCCTEKSATIRGKNDTVFIQTWEVGPQCYCQDDFYFEIVLPQINNDSITISFNGDVVKTTLTDIKNQYYSSTIHVYPNPVNDILNLELPIDFTGDCLYQIIDLQGKIIQNGLLTNQNQIKLNFTGKGQYFLYLDNKTQDRNIVTKFIKQ